MLSLVYKELFSLDGAITNYQWQTDTSNSNGIRHRARFLSITGKIFQIKILVVEYISQEESQNFLWILKTSSLSIFIYTAYGCICQAPGTTLHYFPLLFQSSVIHNTCTKINKEFFKKQRFSKVLNVQQVFAYIIAFRKFWFPGRICKLKRKNPIFAP